VATELKALDPESTLEDLVDQAEQARLMHDDPAFFGDPTWSREA
jgi:hypothetical protein